MNTSNRFEIETMVRQRQAELERQLRRAARLREAGPVRMPVNLRPHSRVTAIIAVAASLSILLAIGLSLSMALAFATFR